MKRIQNIFKQRHLLSFLLLSLFVGHMASTSLFTHSHIYQSKVIVHSHPYAKGADSKPLHSHSEDEFELIQQLSVLNFVLFTLITISTTLFVKKCKTFFLELEHKIPAWNIHYVLRGPPSFSFSR